MFQFTLGHREGEIISKLNKLTLERFEYSELQEKEEAKPKVWARKKYERGY